MPPPEQKAEPARKAPPTSASACPCGSGRTYGECCEPLLREQRIAATAEELMRSRFTAHVIGDERHLHRTYLGTARKPFVASESVAPLAWTRLVVHSHEAGANPTTAFVDFTAYFDDGEREQALHEKSEFTRLDGTWYYARAVRSGPAPIKASPKVGRNDPCPCGSGRKFKHCCGA